MNTKTCNRLRSPSKPLNKNMIWLAKGKTFDHPFLRCPEGRDIYIYLIDKRMYIKREEEAPKTVPSKYTGV